MPGEARGLLDAALCEAARSEVEQHGGAASSTGQRQWWLGLDQRRKNGGERRCRPTEWLLRADQVRSSRVIDVVSVCYA